MVYTSALVAPKRVQWEPNSAPSQAWNCGPTCVTQIAVFYRDSPGYQIEATRQIIRGMGPYAVNGDTVWGAPAQTPTHAWQQRDMLRKRGVPCEVLQINSVAGLHALVDKGTRPVLVGIQMSRVAAAVRGHAFTGWHAVVIIGRAVVNGRVGFYVSDPNFAPAGTGSDQTKGKRFYSDAVMQYALIQNDPRWAVVPNAAKKVAPVAPPVTTKTVQFNNGVSGVNLRTAPDSRKANIYATVGPKNIVRVSDKKIIGTTAARRMLYATVKGADGAMYHKLRIQGTGVYTYCQTQFMHLA